MAPSPWHIQTLKRTERSHVSRLTCAGQSLILKTFPGEAPALEIEIYRLLQRLGVPTLPVHGLEDHALLLEDLESSPTWRLAQEEDMRLPETGRAVAEWYRTLHAAGERYLAGEGDRVPGLCCWVDKLAASALHQAGEKLGLAGYSAWQQALAAADQLTAAYAACPQTFNYTDFAGENLALTQTGARPLRAVVFDYDCFGLGTRASDHRNVIYSLEGEAQQAFREAYGPVDPLEVALDDVLSLLEGIFEAAQREHIPGWARPSIEDVRSGKLGELVEKALSLKLQYKAALLRDEP